MARPGTPPYEGAPPDARQGFAPEGGGEFLQRQGVPREGSGLGPDVMDPIQTPMPYQAPEMGTPNVGSQAFDAGLAATNPNTVASNPAQSTRPAMDNPMDPRAGGRAGAGYRATMKAPNYGGARLTKEDFNSDPRTITVDGHNFSRASFEMPAGAIGMRLQGLAAEQQSLKKAAADMMKEETRPTVKAPYVRSYNQMVDKAQRDYVASVAAQYGGSEAKAWQAILGQDQDNPQAATGWKRLGQDMNALGEVINFDYDQGEKYLNDVADGVKEYDEEAVTATKNMMNGFNQLGPGGFGDVQQLTKYVQDYKKGTALPHYLDKSGFDKHIKDHMGQTYGNESVNRKTKGFTVFSHDQVKSAESIIDAYADQMYPNFKDRFSEEEFKERLHKMYPIQVEHKQTIKANPQPKAGKSGGKPKGWNNGAFDTGNGIRIVPNQRPTEGGVSRSGVFPPDKTNSLTLYRDVDGEMVRLKPDEFYDDKGSLSFMKPVTLEKKKNGWYITGPAYARPREKDASSGGGSQGYTASGGPTVTIETANGPMQFIELPVKSVPLKANEEFAKNYLGEFGGDPDKFMEQYLSGDTGARTAQPQKAASGGGPWDRYK